MDKGVLIFSVFLVSLPVHEETHITIDRHELRRRAKLIRRPLTCCLAGKIARKQRVYY